MPRDYQDGRLEADDWTEQRTDLTAELEAAHAQLARLAAQRDQLAAESAAIDIEGAVMHELTMIRAVVAGEVKDGGHAGTDALRAVLVRLIASFDVVRFPSLGVGGPDGTVVYQGAAPVVEQAVVVQRRCKGLPLPLPSRR